MATIQKTTTTGSTCWVSLNPPKGIGWERRRLYVHKIVMYFFLLTFAYKLYIFKQLVTICQIVFFLGFRALGGKNGTLSLGIT